MGLNEKIKELRLKKKISQKKLADAIGVAQSSINYWEKGQRTPSVDAAQKLADYFNVTLDELYDINDILDSRYVDLFSGASALAEEYENKQKLKQISDSVNKNMQQLTTMAAHFDGTEYTEEELEEIKQFAEFVKSKRNK